VKYECLISRSAGNMANTGAIRNSNFFLGEKSLGKHPLGRRRHRWEGNIIVGLNRDKL
jgi:hypothetical protein